MQTAPVHFSTRARRALADASLREAMAVSRGHFVGARTAAVLDYGDFESLRERGKYIRNQSINEMPQLLRQFEKNATAAGARVLWADDGASACNIITAIARRHNAKVAVKSKSMASEEVGLNAALAAAGIEAVESDLGEFIVQLADEMPSHIIAPALHKTRAEVANLFAANGINTGGDDIQSLTRAARQYMRDKFFAADIGISGANFLFAATLALWRRAMAVMMLQADAPSSAHNTRAPAAVAFFSNCRRSCGISLMLWLRMYLPRSRKDSKSP